MRVLQKVTPTSEQLPIISDYRAGCVVIRGAAGSGKTTTAVLRLRQVTGVWTRQRGRDAHNDDPVRVMVMTYNRTLRGYVEQLVGDQVEGEGVAYATSTFGHWGWETLGKPAIVDGEASRAKIWALGRDLGYERDFLLDEVDYVLGRYLPENRGQYLDADHPYFERTGRGITPRVERPNRQRILTEIVGPHEAWKTDRGEIDWSDVAVQMAQRKPAASERLEIVVIDEAQDFSANQIRGVMNHLADEHSVTFVLDAVQRIYPRGFGWSEVDVQIAQRFPLKQNHRNTKQIAAFAQPLVADLPLEDDGTVPDFTTCEQDGSLPRVVRGRFADQMAWVVKFIRESEDDESVALLHAKGGGWFARAIVCLDAAHIPWVRLQRQSEWPRGREQVALSTLQSAKGLEFDHVILLGLGAEQLPHGIEEGDAQMTTQQRLLAMAIGRARKTVTLTYKPGEEPQVIALLDPATYEVVNL